MPQDEGIAISVGFGHLAPVERPRRPRRGQRPSRSSCRHRNCSEFSLEDAPRRRGFKVDVGVHGSAGGKEAGTGSPVTAPRTPSGSATVSPSERIVAAARQGDSTMLRTYLTSFSPEETLDKDKCNALHLLAKAGLLEPILPLLSECPIWREALSHRNTDQNTPLHMCNFNLISLKLISAARSDALQVSNKDGNILLHMSVLANTLSVSDRIIDVGGLEQLDIKNKVSVTSQHTRSLPFCQHGLTPVELAIVRSNEKHSASGSGASHPGHHQDAPIGHQQVHRHLPVHSDVLCGGLHVTLIRPRPLWHL
uniref:Uncharacterized protein n=1 Tax=Vitrella brassicaformis TaxID=1169539 RepID=A0A7S1PD39_9ALVE